MKRKSRERTEEKRMFEGTGQLLPSSFLFFFLFFGEGENREVVGWQQAKRGWGEREGGRQQF